MDKKHGLFLPASYQAMFEVRDVTDLAGVETVRIPAVTPHRFVVRTLASLLALTIFLLAAVLWLVFWTPIGLSALVLGAILYSFCCARLIQPLLMPDARAAQSAAQFHWLKKDTASYLQAIRARRRGGAQP